MASCVRGNLITLILLVFLLPALPVRAGSENWQVESRVNWTEGALLIKVTAPLPTSGRNFPAAEHAVRREIEREIPRLFHDAVRQLRVGSSSLMSDEINDHPQTATAVLAAVQTPQMVRVRRTPDMRNVEVDYRLELFPRIAETLVSHTDARPLPRVAGWVPTRRYSGVLIFARGRLPVHGESSSAELRPALLPTVYDQNLRRILSHEKLAGDIARERGVLRYVSDLDDPLVGRIAGPDPLRIHAVGVFGNNRSDIMIPQSAADRLLYGQDNSAVLENARIVVVISAAGTVESLSVD